MAILWYVCQPGVFSARLVILFNETTPPSAQLALEGGEKFIVGFDLHKNMTRVRIRGMIVFDIIVLLADPTDVILSEL